MGQITKVTPDMIQVANNVTSRTVGNTTSGISLTFDSNGVITSAANVTLSVANTQLTGTINSAQIASNTISNTNIATGAIENYLRTNALDFGMRNRIINGAMVIDQRNNGSSVSINNTVAYTLDRWEGSDNTDGVIQIQQSSTAPTGFTKSLQFTTTTADGSLSAGQYAYVAQYIEGLNTADLNFGTANAKPITLSFWVRSSLTGTFGGSISNDGYDRSYPFTYTISSANTWEQKSITISGDQSGTWLTTNGVGVRVYFCLGAASNRLGTANQWASSWLIGGTGSTSVIGTLNATWNITGVQLEEGSTATSFDYRPYGTELQLCQRYYQRSYNIGTATGTSFNSNYEVPAYFIGTGNFGFVSSKTFPTSMRANPTITVYADNGTAGSVTPWNSSPSAIASVNAIENGITAGNFNNNTSAGVVYGFAYTASAEL